MIRFLWDSYWLTPSLPLFPFPLGLTSDGTKLCLQHFKLLSQDRDFLKMQPIFNLLFGGIPSCKHDLVRQTAPASSELSSLLPETLSEDRLSIPCSRATESCICLKEVIYFVKYSS